jgi:hypothetical protein
VAGLHPLGCMPASRFQEVTNQGGRWREQVEEIGGRNRGRRRCQAGRCGGESLGSPALGFAWSPLPSPCSSFCLLYCEAPRLRSQSPSACSTPLSQSPWAWLDPVAPRLSPPWQPLRSPRMRSSERKVRPTSSTTALSALLSI